jgi:hypothetical protein
MPQLAFETFISQFFWLFVIFFLFNHFILHQFIPDIAKLIKIRKKFVTTTQTHTNNKSNLNIQLPQFNTTSIINNNQFNNIKNTWMNNNK